MRFAGWAARRVLQQAFHIDPTKKSCVQQYWCRQRLHPLQSEFKIYFYPIKHGSPLEHCSEGLPCFIFILLCPVFCRCRAACRKSCLRTGPLAPFAAHGGLRRPLRSAHASALALRGRLRAKSRAFSAIVRKGGTAPTRACGCGPPPLFGGIRRVACTLLRKDARLCHRHLFPGRFFYFFTFFNSLFRRCGFQLAFSLHLKFLNTTRFDFSIGSLPPFTSSFYSNSHHFVSRATTRMRPLSLWLSQVLNVKSCSPHCAPAPPQ